MEATYRIVTRYYDGERATKSEPLTIDDAIARLHDGHDSPRVKSMELVKEPVEDHQ